MVPDSSRRLCASAELLHGRPHRHQVAGARWAEGQLLGLRRQPRHQGLVKALVRHLQGMQTRRSDIRCEMFDQRVLNS
jgi:hypothetical protein